MKQYAAACCYFGQWPNYFGFWLNSCSYNQQIDFFLVSDISVEGYTVPDNVHIVRMSFQEVQSLVQEKFPDIKVNVNRPYKLCDFKTAYGHIFDNLFEGYDYWGFYDIDTIWGNIVKFIPENKDSHIVKVFPCGHLSFIRNISPYNKIYELVNEVSGTPCRNNMEGKHVSDWQDCFSSPESHYYDEEGGLEPYIAKHTEIEAYHQVVFDNILPPWRFDHFLCINFPEKSSNLVYSFDNGALCRHYREGMTCRQEEIGYLHVSKRRFTIETPVASRFCIYPSRFVEWREWNLIGLLVHGRPRRLWNLLARVKSKFINK